MVLPSPSADPNFPANLNLAPLRLDGTSTAAGGDDAHGQEAAIGRYGIAGRVWEASGPLLSYLSPGNKGSPACSLFTDDDDRAPYRILELGSGQALASLHLAARLRSTDTVVLTDLPNVVPLCEQSVATWRESGEGKDGENARVVVQPLAWGEDASHLAEFGPFTHIVLCDLVSCPGLIPADGRSTSPTCIPRSSVPCSKSQSQVRCTRLTRTPTSSALRSFFHVRASFTVDIRD
jgi:hypothetical protein